MKCGVVLAGQLKEENYMYAGCQMVYLFAVPLLYQGLLSISYVIHDPFGEDLLDFPIMAFQEYANAQSVSLGAFAHRCPSSQTAYGPDATIEELALRKQLGKVHAQDFAARMLQSGMTLAGDEADNTDGRAEREVTIRAELSSAVSQQVAAKDALMSTLQKQREILESELAGLNSRLQSLEQKSTNPA